MINQGLVGPRPPTDVDTDPPLPRLKDTVHKNDYSTSGSVHKTDESTSGNKASKPPTTREEFERKKGVTPSLGRA